MRDATSLGSNVDFLSFSSGGRYPLKNRMALVWVCIPNDCVSAPESGQGSTSVYSFKPLLSAYEFLGIPPDAQRVNRQNQRQQNEPGGPRLAVSVVVSRNSIGVNHYGKRCSRLAVTGTPERITKRRKQQRRRFTGDPRQSSIVPVMIPRIRRWDNDS